ncbi:MAG: diguanylate cyclase [Campylobacterota bacterium]|nr:diguanylate cyclase [Campylobacterota bacterium]
MEVIISTIILTTQSVKTIQNMANKNVIQYEKQLITAKKEALKNYVDMAKAVLKIYRDKVTSQTTSLELEQIKKDAIKALDSMIYGDDTGYVFVWSYDGVPLAFNPRPDLIGQNLLHLKGGNGKMVIQDHIANAKKGGGHFYTYKWKTTKGSSYQTKISYSFGVQDWGWFVGTGEYMHKEEKEIEDKKVQITENTNQLISIIMVSAFVLILITSTILYFLVRKVVTHPLRNLKYELSNFFLFLQNKKENLTFDYIYSNDEIGQMSKEINDNIQVSVKLHKQLKDSEAQTKILNETLEEKVKIRTTELKEQQETFEAIFNNSKDAIAILDMESNFLDVNPAYIEMIGFSKNELLNNSCINLSAPEDIKHSEKAAEEVIRAGYIKNFEKKCLKKDGTYITVNMSMSIINNPQRILTSVRDVTKLKNAEQQLKLLASIDPLTSLYNRRSFIEMSESILSLAKRNKTDSSILMLDIDKFKNVNDTYGHQIGDEVIKSLSLILQENSRASDIISRWGGEEFIVLLPETHINGASIIAEKIRKNIEEMVINLLNNKKLRYTVSIGVSQVDNEKDLNIEAPINRADEALYKAKESGRNRVVCS